MSRRSKTRKPPEGGDLFPPRYVVLGVCGFLLLAVAVVFGQTLKHGFINFDDGPYVYENPHVTRGLTADGIAWAFTTTHAANWHPLTWLSHMLDCQLYDLRPWGHHLSSVVLHAAAAVALFLTLRQMTGDLWPSALVAAVFAIHPLRVESVAWVAERKDVLSGLFFMLTLAAYVSYTRRPFSLLRYLTVVALLALGLMAKPMLVTLPFVLLLLDYWPLRRFAAPGRSADRFPSSGFPTGSRAPAWEPAIGVPQRELGNEVHSTVAWRLVIEKLPLLALSAASCVVTPLVQAKTVARLDFIPLWSRIANALVSYVAYARQLFFPQGLALFYPHPGATLPLWKAAGAALLLAGVSAAVVAWRRKYPYLLVGWLWYLGMLVPVIGLVQVGQQAMADRYTYLPEIGLVIALAWGAKRLLESWPSRAWLWGTGSALMIAALMGCAWQQASYWQDRETLWNHTLACTSDNALAHSSLAVVLCGQGRMAEAIEHLEQAREIRPDYPEVYNNLGVAFAKQKKYDDAAVYYQQALKLKPDHANAHANFGTTRYHQGRMGEAIAEFQAALQFNPDDVAAHNNLGAAFVSQKRFDEAIDEYQKVLAIKPEDVTAYNNLGEALYAQGRMAEAIGYYEKALVLASRQNNVALVNSIRARIELCRPGSPLPSRRP